MSLYVYENHLGGLYFHKNYNKTWLRTCSQCGDSDHCFGSFESPEDFISSVKNRDGFFPYDETDFKIAWYRAKQEVED